MRQTVALVDISKYRSNLLALKGLIGPDVKLMAVVKADAYGHGLVPMATAAQEAGADYLGVALMEEGLALRHQDIHMPILVLAGLSEESTLSAVEAGLTLCCHTGSHLAAAVKAANQVGKPAKVHVKIDSGMNRIGTKGSEELQNFLHLMEEQPQVHMEGAFTHFACADDPDPTMTNRQLAVFQEMAKHLPTGLLLHTSGSSALIKRPDARLNMVRAGISSYGYSPVPCPVPLQPVLSWLAEITHVKEVASGETISYGATATAQETLRIATLAVGYGDGYNRLLSNKADVLINGVRCRVQGRVCMDQIMVDVSKAGDVKPGMQAVLLGQDGNETITADELARLQGTISYEVLLAISKRVPRIYLNQ